MKHALKQILKSLGLYKTIYRIYLDGERKKYRDHEFCQMNYKGVQLKFQTIDQYSNHWFFPRFGKGLIHEPGATNVFIDYIKKDAIVFDVGAHLGYFTCLASALASEGFVYAFEVDPKCIASISKNVEVNNQNNVKISNVAISDNCGTINIPVFNSPNPGIHIEDSINNNFIEVSSTTLDTFIESEKTVPDFIKIDVEGAEYKVLKGMTKLLENMNLTLLIEIHPKQLRKFFNTDYREVLDYLSKYGFDMAIVESYRKNNFKLKNIDITYELTTNEMILCSKKPL